MSKIRILATEDDPIHEEKLRMVMDVLNYELIDVLTDPHCVISVINATQPDVLLIDIDLNSDISGIDLVATINETQDIPTVFLTSFQDLETFNRAKDTLPAAYITKPYKANELERAIELAVFNKKKEFRRGINIRKTTNQKHLFIKNENSLKKVLLEDIRLIEADDKYCYIYTQHKKFMLKERLKNILNQLPDTIFVQVHRSYVINIESIDDIQLSQNKLSVNGKVINIGKTFKQHLFSKINILV